MKDATNTMFTHLYANTGIKKIGEKAMSDMVKYYRQINNGTMEGNPVITSVDQDAIFLVKRKSQEVFNIIK